MNDLRVVCGIDPSLEFARPLHVWRAASADDARRALDEAEEARRDGAWIAGYVSYELGAAFVREPVRGSSWPLLALGAFDRPQSIERPGGVTQSKAALIALEPYASYARAIAAIRRAIYDGDVYQVNYTVPFALDSAGDPFAWWRETARATGAKYQAYVEDGARRVLSWSPELFLAFDGSRLETRPMKGTAPPGAPDELANAKNRAEHVMIVDLLRNDLHRICDDVRVETLFDVESYPTFVTMTSTIAGTLRGDAGLREIFEAMFPCGSVTGAPKRAAVAAIAELEPRTRDAYCGTVGFLSPARRGWWNVAIRTAQIDDAAGSARFDAGGGIVADSEAASEWNELHVKTAFLRDERFAMLETFAGDATDERIALHAARLGAALERLGAPVRCGDIFERLRAARADAKTLVRVRAGIDGTMTVAHAPLETPAEPVRVVVTPQRVRSSDPFLRFKTSRRSAYDAAAAYALERDSFEGLLRNERDELTEGARTTLFVERDGALLTPPLASGVLPGILRHVLVTEGRARECTLTAEDLERSDAVYIGNSARGLLRATIVKDPS